LLVRNTMHNRTMLRVRNKAFFEDI